MYPVSYAADPAIEGRNRLSTFFRYFAVIPWSIVLTIWAIGVLFTIVVAWFALVFTGRYPRGLYDFHAKYSRLGARINGFTFLATDEWPPFHGNPDDSYPIRLGIPEPLPKYNRAKAAFRLIVGIPVILLSYVQNLISSVVSFIAWFTIVFTGKVPEGLFDALRMALAYQARAGAYFLLITEDYPPFSFDPNVEKQQVGSPSTPSLEQPQTERETGPGQGA
jgi:hypothetical protein